MNLFSRSSQRKHATSFRKARACRTVANLFKADIEEKSSAKIRWKRAGSASRRKLRRRSVASQFAAAKVTITKINTSHARRSNKEASKLEMKTRSCNAAPNCFPSNNSSANSNSNSNSKCKPTKSRDATQRETEPETENYSHFDPYSVYADDEDVWFSSERLFEVSARFLSIKPRARINTLRL